MYRDKKIAVVVPAYNEEKQITKVFATMPDYVDRIIVVDDQSKDKTSAVVMHYYDERVVLLRHKKNQGVGGAIITGHKRAIEENMDISVVMAGDAQMDPKYLPKLLDPVVDDKCEYSKGNRFLHTKELKRMPAHRIFGNTILTFFTKLASGYWSIFDPQNGYTAIKVSTLRELPLDQIHKRFQFENDLLVHLNIISARVKDVAIPARYGTEKSKIKLWHFIPSTLWYLFVALHKRIHRKYVVANFHPLVLLLFAGIPLFLIGFAFGIYILYRSYGMGISPTTGQILIVLLPSLVGIQFILAAFISDILAEPK